VLVGHSLGSVIAYDVLGRLWDDYRDRFWQGTDRLSKKTAQRVKLPVDGQQRLIEIERKSVNLRKATDKDDIKTLRQEYKRAQLSLWDEQRKMGNRWLITDLVTLGSPISHSKYLLRLAKNNLAEKFERREYPECPPSPNIRQGSDETSLSYNVSTVKVIIPSAVFAQVRWTNLWFPGDVIGGEVGPSFGNGIEDVRINRKRRLMSWLPTAHTKYWDPKEPEAIDGLQDALELANPDVIELLKTHACFLEDLDEVA
jgi:hypothetical protein